jgi:hypothetical protein
MSLEEYCKVVATSGFNFSESPGRNRPIKINRTNKIFFFHLVKRGLLKVNSNTSTDYLLEEKLLKFAVSKDREYDNYKKGQKNHEEILSNVEFLLRHGLRSIDFLRDLAPQFFTVENLTVLKLQLMGTSVNISSILSVEENVKVDQRIKDYIFLLDQHLVTEVSKIVLSLF